jgi:hypothetical protein
VGSEDVLSGVFYIANSRIALFFDQLVPAQSQHDHSVTLMVFNTEQNRSETQLVVHADPKAFDITNGPDGGVLFGREGALNFYNSSLQPLRSIPLAPGTTGVRFNRILNQLVILTVDEKSGDRTAHFKDGSSLEESASLSYPIKSQAVFGKDELVYLLSGNCRGASHVMSARVVWHGLDQLSACDPLAFIEKDSLAYASGDRLYIVDSKSHSLLNLRIPAPSTFQLPQFVGLSDDHTRLAISALRREKFTSEWPYYDEIFIYDLVSKRMIFEHALKKGSPNGALSPDGRQLATIEEGILTLLSLP